MKNTAIQIYRWGGVFLSSILAATVLTLFSACDSPSSSWEEPVRDYFDKYTNTAAIEKIDITCQSNKDNSGATCIPSDGNKTITFYLRNPRQYTLNIDFPNATEGSGITVEQDMQDKTVIRLTYPQSYLVQHDGSGNTGLIGGTIRLTENETLREFEPFSFKLKCNSPPPAANGQSVQAANGHYIVCFYLPTQELDSETHQNDSHTIYINGEAVANREAGGSVTPLPGKNVSTTKPTGLATITGSGADSFTGSSTGCTAVYYDTELTAKTGEYKQWSICIKDNDGLSSKTVNAASIVTPANLSINGTDVLTTEDGENSTTLIPHVDSGTIASCAWAPASSEVIDITPTNNSKTATITAKNGGTENITITATLADGRKVTTTKTIRVLAINFADDTPEDFLKDQSSVSVSASSLGFPSGSSSISYTTGDSTIATINSSGSLTLKTKGTTTITASRTYGDKTVSATKNIYVHEVKIVGNTEIFVDGDTLTLAANVESPDSRQTPSGITYTWSSSNSKATVGEATGVVTAVSGGAATISLKAKLNGKETTAITKGIQIYELTISGNTMLDKTKGAKSYTASLKCGNDNYGSTGLSYEWSSGTPATATALGTTATGSVTPVAGGSTVITVTAKKNGTMLTSATKTVYVIEVGGVKSFIIGDIFGHALEPVPSASEVSGTISYSWSSLNTANASADSSSGVVTAIAKSSIAKIRLTATCGSETLPIDTQITVSELKISPTPSSTVELAENESVKFRYWFDPALPDTITGKSIKVYPSSASNTVSKAFSTASGNTYITLSFTNLAALSEGDTRSIRLNVKFGYEEQTIDVATLKYVTSHEVSLSDLATYLQNLPANDSTTPCKLKITGLQPSDLAHSTGGSPLVKIIEQKGKYVDLSETQLPVLTSMQNSFADCDHLVVAPNIPSGVTNMGGCFNGCDNLRIPPEEIPNTVTNMASCFYDCSSLISAPGWETFTSTQVTNMGGCFRNCSSLQSTPPIPASITTISSCFSGCTNLSGEVNVYSPSLTDSSNWTNTFNGCTNITRVYVKSAAVKNALVNSTGNSSISADSIYPYL
ncbi:MAG TPA: hypothetical protein DCZ76_07535 [Treponema sp.]|nr:hypothetical protein [Treponema sp.]